MFAFMLLSNEFLLKFAISCVIGNFKLNIPFYILISSRLTWKTYHLIFRFESIILYIIENLYHLLSLCYLCCFYVMIFRLFHFTGSIAEQGSSFPLCIAFTCESRLPLDKILFVFFFIFHFIFIRIIGICMMFRSHLYWLDLLNDKDIRFILSIHFLVLLFNNLRHFLLIQLLQFLFISVDLVVPFEKQRFHLSIDIFVLSPFIFMGYFLLFPQKLLNSRFYIPGLMTKIITLVIKIKSTMTISLIFGFHFQISSSKLASRGSYYQS